MPPSPSFHLLNKAIAGAYAAPAPHGGEGHTQFVKEKRLRITLNKRASCVASLNLPRGTILPLPRTATSQLSPALTHQN